MKKLISKRFLIQGIIGITLYFLISMFHLSLLWILIAGSIIGIVFGKAFCRWMCPIGFIMELMFKGSEDQRKQQMYMYYKAGCPIAWISGFLNKYSIFKIKRDKNTCISCGKCDKACYITSLNTDFSLYKGEKLDPSKNYKCSKCLACVKECPVNSLKVGI